MVKIELSEKCEENDNHTETIINPQSIIELNDRQSELPNQNHNITIERDITSNDRKHG